MAEAEKIITVTDFYGCDVFGEKEMKARLPEDVYEKFTKSIQDGEEMTLQVADQVAGAMKDWAIEKGATHYTHWFQPLTGVTAEKHDSFLDVNAQNDPIMSLSGKNLIKGETDGSSFPSGGLRATFEARGYTTWDCTSPAFIREDATGATLCIPTAFCAYTGEALDKKTPLLRSVQALDEQAIRLLRAMGNTTSKHVIPQVGAEQEYFLVRKEKYDQRKDLVYTGHTLFGAMPPKGQELDDHYYGAIKESVGAYMKDINHELWKLGVPAKTQHNEVAPSQHELAPIFEQVNIAVDHNQMMMETMKKVAERHGYVCLLHEKPFAGVNGSGKHNNWSIATDDGINLLKPRKPLHEDRRFLLVCACIISAVDKHADLLRQSASDVGNDLRLGANEAPPAIVSIFLGEQLQNVIDQLCSKGSATYSMKGGKFKTGVNTIAGFDKDATDRNRTSPFAFTGNKFEFRMVGASDSIANCNVVLNTIVAEAFRDAADFLTAAEDPDAAAADLTIRLLTDHGRVIFNGNGYAESWVKEAEERGLPNYPSMVDAIPALTTPKAVRLFEDFRVFTQAELESRAEIEYEAYAKEINIEARTMIDMAGKQIIPAVVEYVGSVAASLNTVKTAVPGADVSAQTKIITEVSSHLSSAKKAMDKLRIEVGRTGKMKDGRECALYYRDNVVPAMAELRKPVDALEMLVDKDLWPMPSYGDLIF